MPEPLKPYWVTIEVARGCTQDHRITARSEWTAAWLWAQLHPDQTVLMVREVR